MPVYNEAKTVREIVRQVQAVPVEKEILIVDDGSTDGTRALLREMDGKDGVRVFLQPHNQGKGAAVSVVFRHAAGDVVVVQDADLEYDPREYPKLLRPIEEGHADVVYGSRFLGGGERRVLYFWHTVGNRFLTLASNMATNLNLTDMETCYKMFRREVVQSMTIESRRFGIEPEITAKVARRGYRVYEVPISYYGRTYDEGKKIGWKDACSALWTIIKHRFREAEESGNVGHVTLARLAKLEPYNRWLVGRFSHALGRRVLEIGAGFGNLTRYLVGWRPGRSRPRDRRGIGRGAGGRRVPERHVPRQPGRAHRLVPFSAHAGRARRSPRPLDRHDRLLQRARAHRGRPRNPGGHARDPAAGRTSRPARAGPLVALRHARRAAAPLPALREGGARGEAREGRVCPRGLPVREPRRHPRLVHQRTRASPPRAPARAAPGLQVPPSAPAPRGTEASEHRHVAPRHRPQTGLRLSAAARR